MKTGSLIIVYLIATFLFVLSVAFIANKIGSEIEESGGLKPIIAKVWCGDKWCMDK